MGQVEVIDRLSQGKLTTEYKYHYGYWDGAEREFRGFGMVEQSDTETFADYAGTGLHGNALSFAPVEERFFSPPTLTKTWFHQGAVGDEFSEWEELKYRDFWQSDPQVLTRPPEIEETLENLPRRAKRDAFRAMRGQVLRTELYALDGTERASRPYTVTESLPGVREEVPPEERNITLPESVEPRHIFFAFGIAQRTTQWERGDEPMTQFGFTEDYDSYGQPRSQISIAVPRHQGEPLLATQSETEYVYQDTETTYIVDRVAEATAYEIINDGSLSVEQLKAAISDNSVTRNLIGQTLSYYDGEAFVGLPYGEIGNYGAVVRSETLVLTKEILQAAYQGDDTQDIPVYLDPDSPTWTDEYPQAFREQLAELPELAGYTFYPGDGRHARGYFVTTARNKYDFQDTGISRGLLLTTRPPLGNETGNRDTSITYDDYALLPVTVTDPLGLTTSVVYDYRVLQPREAIDPNGNRTLYSFTPLGLLANTAVMEKAGENVGDTLAVPSTRLEYDFLAFEERQQPISVRTIQREHHVNETDVPDSERDATIETIEYSDGFGRLLQTRTQAEDLTFGDIAFGNEVLPRDQGDETATRADVVGRRRNQGEPANVVVSGWQIYDNKGRVVEQYEPFYDRGWDYVPPQAEQYGQKATMYYDPRGQVIRTVNPDGSEQRVIYGIPEDLTNPEEFIPTPWEAYTYDANDNAERTHGTGDATHWNTPASIEIDALGRTIRAIARNGSNSATDWYVTLSTYDIRGNLLTVTDALERPAFSYFYDLSPKGEEDESSQVLRIESIDAGIKRIIFDAVGNEIERRDSKGALILSSYDLVDRPIRVWARDDRNSEVTLRERLEYGDGSDPNQPEPERNDNRDRNLLGQLTRYYDEAGLIEFENYDFKGNLLGKIRRVISDQSILSVSAFRVNWQPPPGTTLADYANALLDAGEYRTEMTYDALNRVKMMRYPQDVEGERRELRPQYNRAGALERVELNSTTYVEQIAYNAKGQRTLIAYGNGIMTRYAYDPQTFRLVRLRTEGYEHPNSLTYIPKGAPLQDFAYEYDLAGNILTIRDRTPDSGILNSPLGRDALDRVFSYDPLYRLLSATGRECDIPPTPYAWTEPPSFGSSQRCADLTRTRPYQEQYQYDSAGNMLQLSHQHFLADGSLMGRNRDFTVETNSNRLDTVTVGQQVYNYEYDSSGNLIRENLARYFEWDHSDRLRVFRIQANNSEPSVHAHYLYDASGQRVKKLVRKGSDRVEVTVYIDGIFEYHRLVRGDTAYENNTLHVMDDQQRIAMVRVGNAFPDDGAPNVRVKYHLGDHLGSSNLVIDDSGSWINREEYTPYGETSFGSFARKRYRFAGKERDEESSLFYFGARYYSVYCARWTNTDPVELKDGLNQYSYTKNNPILFTDEAGQYRVKKTKNVSSEIGERIIEKFNELSFRKTVRGKGVKQGASTGINIRLKPFGPYQKKEKRDPNYLKPYAGEGKGYTYCVAATWMYALKAIEEINTENKHYSFGDIQAGDYKKLARFQALWYRAKGTKGTIRGGFGAPQALVEMGLGYYVEDFSSELEPGAVINVYGWTSAPEHRRQGPGVDIGTSIIFMQYGSKKGIGSQISEIWKNQKLGFFGKLSETIGVIGKTIWDWISGKGNEGIHAIHQGKEQFYSFEELEKRKAKAANWYPVEN